MKLANQETVIRLFALGYLSTHHERGDIYRYRTNWGHFCKAIKIKGHICNGGYLQTTLKLDGKRYEVLLHNIVWLRKHGHIKDRMVINHKNHIKTDNRISNLEEITQSQNMKNAYKHKKHWRTK